MSQHDLPAAFDEIVRRRRSVRGFLPTPVPRDELRQLFATAGCAPSNCNTQPWKVYVVSGAARDRLAQEIASDMARGVLSPDYPYEGRYEGIYQQRQHDAARQLYQAMGIARDDRAARDAAMMRNFDFFGAPHVAFFFLPRGFGIREAADLGMCAQTLMLALSAHGLASCAQTTLGFHPQRVREVVAAPESETLLFGISLGYEDPEQPANAARVGRGQLEQNFSFVE